MLTYQVYQVVAVVTGVAGAALTGWVMVRTLRKGVVETRLGTIPKARYPRAYRAFVAFYGVGIAVLLLAAATGGSLLLSGKY